MRILSPTAARTALAFGILVHAVLCAGAQASSSPSTQTIVQELTSQLPLAFEENKGQADPSVRFVSRGPGYKLFFTQHDAVMVLGDTRNWGKSQADRAETDGSLSDRQTAVVRMFFEGGSPTATVEGLDRLGFKTNYFIGGDSPQVATDIANHAKVKYKAIYPGIDVIYYGNQQKLEYDLVLAPRARPQQVRLRFAGADSIHLSESGDLVLGTVAGNLTYHKPVAYQVVAGKRKPVEARYLLASNGQVGFEVGRYDTSKPLVIDPILSYSSFLWGIEAKGVAVDSTGNVYVTGYINTTDLPATGGYKATLTGTTDAYVAKLDPTGKTLIYATYLGARRANTFGNAIAVDSNGSAYIAGTTDSASFPVTSGAYQTTFSSGASFVTKLNATGNALSYSTFLNGATVASIALDSAGSAYMTGRATALTTTTNAFQRVLSGGAAAFAAKLNPTATGMTYATYLGGSGTDEGKSIAVDGSGNAYVTGIARSTNFPLQNPMKSTLSGTQDAFVTKVNATGSGLVYSTYLGGAANDYGNGIAVDGAGQAYVAGWTNSDNFPVTPGVFQPSKGYAGTQVSNAFISKINDTGTALVYSSYLGGKWCLAPGVSSCLSMGSDGIDAATAVAVDSAGYAYVGGYATSVGFPLADPVQPIRSGGDEWRTPFVAKVKPTGDRLVYSVVLGARAQDERLHGLAVDRNGSVYAVGYNGYAGSDYPITSGVQKATGSAFIFKLSTGKYPTTLQSSVNPAVSTQPVTFTADVLSTTTGGTVTYMNGATTLGTVPVVNGAATLTTSLPVGVHKITAIYSGDGKVSPPIFQVVNEQ